MSNDRIDHVGYRVMRHREMGNEAFAIHEVYFSADGRPQGHSEDALSPREPSVEQLRLTLKRLLEQGGEEITAGDLRYAYARVEIEEMLRSVEHPPLDFEEEPNP